jgi:VWFA-related protein
MKYKYYFLLLALIAFPLSSQDYQVTVSSVHVWIKATGKDGQPVRGLTQDQFEIYEDNVRVPITCFEEQVTSSSAAAPGSAKPAEVVSKKVVLYLDLYNTSSREYLSIRPHISEFLDSISNGSYEVMLAALMPTGKLGIVSHFTNDINRIRILVNKAQAGPDRSITVRNNLAEINRVLGEGGGGGKASVDLVDKVRDAYQLAKTYARRDQDQSEYTLEAVQKFAEYLSKETLGEDPVVVYVSGGFSVDPGRQYYDVVTDVASSQATNTEDYREISFVQEYNIDMRTQIKKTLGKLNKMNVPFYTGDTGGLGGASEYQDSLVEIADQTGGTSFYNSQNFQLGFQNLATDLSQQYLLCYQAPQHPKSGDYHSIKVKVNKSDVDLRYRKGYID